MRQCAGASVMTGWTLAKYALALAGLALVLIGENLSRPWIGYVGLGLIAAAFLLRFLQRRSTPSGNETPTSD